MASRSPPSLPEEPPRFSGSSATPSPEVFEAARRNNPLQYRLIAEAYKKFAQSPENRGRYADPEGSGGTPEQIWRFFTLFGFEMHCVLARMMPDDQVQGIRRLHRRSPEQLVDLLRELQRLTGEINVTTLHHDGQTGHCIRITDYDAARDRFIYHDPWPLDLLLCKANNRAGVAAQREGGRWSVTAEELGRVIFASYLFPFQWARLNGETFDLLYDDWQSGDFCRFFHLKLLDERDEDGLRRRLFTAGPFKDHVALAVDCAKNGKLVSATLRLGQDWARSQLMMALDIAKSFVTAFAPPPDQAAFAEISRTLWALRDREFFEGLPREPSADLTISCVQAFLGAIPSQTVPTDFGSITIRNVTIDNKTSIELAIRLF